ncbi:MAG TPA: alpha/beta hydrolase [Actinomycetota bacterium]
MDEIEVGGHRIAYQRKGDGVPLLLLHGWPMDGREWRRQVDGLSDEFTVVAWDAPGAGRSSDPPAGFRLPDWADCLASFIQALGLGRAHVAGLSWGGGLALELYRRHPEAVRTLILASAYAGWAGSLPAEVVEQRLELMLRNSELPPRHWAPALVETFFSKGAPPEIFREAASIVSDLHPAATRVAMQAFAEADLREVLPRIEVPALLLCGAEDVRAPRSVWAALHSGIPGSKLVLIPGVGHVIDIEAPERFNAEVRAFLRARPSGVLV